MERTLLWSAIAVGVVGWLCGLLLPPRTRAGRDSDAPDAGGNRAGSAGGLGAVGRPFVWLAAGVPFAVLLMTLPSRGALFSPGHGWGRGFFLGGLLALLAGWTVLRVVRGNRRGASGANAALLVAVPCSLALIAVALPLLYLRPAIVDALVGVAIGWFAVTLALYAGLDESDGTTGRPSPLGAALVLGAGFAITLCAAATLGMYRAALTPQMAKGLWSATSVVLAAGVPFALLLGALPGQVAGDNALPRLGVRLVASTALLAGLGALLALKVVGEVRLIPIVFAGLLLAPVVWWVLRDAAPAPGEDSGGSPPAATHSLSVLGSLPAVLALLAVAAGFMSAFQLLQGFGVGVLLLAMWLAAAVSLSSAGETASPSSSAGPRRNTLVGRGAMDAWNIERGMQADAATRGLIAALLLGVVLLVYRVFATRYADALRGVTLTDHYAFFGFLVGAALPGLLTGLLFRRGDDASGALAPGASALPDLSPDATEEDLLLAPLSVPSGAYSEDGVGRASLPRLLLVGALALAAPGVLVLLWGAKCALALLAGLALGSVAGLSGARSGGFSAPSSTARTVLLPGLLALAVALVLAQFTHLVLPLSDMTRVEKIRALAVVVGALAALLVASDFAGRSRRRGPSAPTVVPATEGAPR